MTFNDNKSIYEQIVDFGYARVISGDWPEEGRIPSTKDLAIQMGVNPRTVMKAYDRLAEEQIIYQRLGLGYFISGNARERVLDVRRLEFRKTQVPAISAMLSELGYTTADLVDMIDSYNNSI